MRGCFHSSLFATRGGRRAKRAGGAGAPGETPIRHAPKAARATFPALWAEKDKAAHGWILAFTGMTILWLLLSPAQALTPDELLANPALETRARAISSELRCLVCQNQSIDDSDAPLARDLRGLIREHLVKGESDAEIMDYVVARYGEYVLLNPRVNTRTLALWAAPFVVLLLAAIALLMRRRPKSPAPEGPLTDAERQVLQKALE